VETGAAVAGRATTGSNVATSAIELGVLGAPQENLSVQGTISQSNGTPVPSFDPALIGQLNFIHNTSPQTNYLSYGTNALVTNTTTANAGLASGFFTGATASLNFNNNYTNGNSQNTGINPFNGS